VDPKTWDGPGVDAWSPWTPDELAQRLDGFARPWCVVGGFAIDLFLDATTRPHLDLEIAVARADLPLVRAHLPQLVFHAVGDGSVRRLRADEAPPLDRHQSWGLDERAGAWRVDVMVEPGDADWWVYRRDEQIRRPRAEMVSESERGVPYLRPEGTLLFKAKRMSPKDDLDFAACLPRMETTARAWLADALRTTHPGHAWIDALG
jgi:hypothetical protein